MTIHDRSLYVCVSVLWKGAVNIHQTVLFSFLSACFRPAVPETVVINCSFAFPPCISFYCFFSPVCRYSRKEGYFDSVPKNKGYPKKLCFKFGPKSHGWREGKN